MSDYYPDNDDFGPLFDAKPTAPPADDTLTEHKAAIVLRLKEGPATCREIDRLTPARGQALVHTLKREGHQIATERVEGQRCYVYYGFDPKQVRARKTSLQEAYYQTPHWRATRAQRLDIDGHQCQQCGSREELEVHHWFYRLFAEDVRRDLITLCKTCHESVHDWIKGGACHFPETVSEDIARRLGWEPKE